MSITDGAKKLYRDSKLGLSAQTVITVLAAWLADSVTQLSGVAVAAIGTAAGAIVGTITAWVAKRGAPTPPTYSQSSRLTND